LTTSSNDEHEVRLADTESESHPSGGFEPPSVGAGEPIAHEEQRILEWFDDPQWFKDAVIYQTHVKAFFDCDNDGIGDFAGLAQKLDYIQDLGVNTIWLLPFYPSPMRDDGYDIADYGSVASQYGTLDDFKNFIAEAHRRRLKVITELVINHTSDQHPWFQEARNSPPGSPKREFYVWSDSDKKFAETRIIFTDTESSNWQWDAVAGQYYWHRFFSHQPDLNHNNPEVVDAVIDVMRFWLDMGVDGLRLDAIPYLCVREGTNNENLPETHAVIRRMRAVVDSHYRGRMFLAEANQWPEDVREYFGEGDECHMAYHFPLMPRIFMAVALEDRFPIAEILRQTPEIPDNCQWAIFLRNHDELTLEMVTDRERDYMYRMYAQEPRMRVNVGIRRRLAPLLDNDLDRIKLMMGLLFSMPGSPILYYGDELGMGDNIFLGDRNGVRTPMQWSLDRNAGFSRADPQRLYLPAIMDPIYGYQAVNVEAQQRDRSSLLNWTKRVLAIRRRYRSFGRGALEFVRPRNRKILAYVRHYEDEIILCVANLSQTAQAVELDLSKYRGHVPIELSGNNAFPPIGDLPYLLTLPAHGYFWMHLRADAEAPAWHVEHLPPAELPVLVLSGALGTLGNALPPNADQAVARRAVKDLEGEVLPEFLRARRWFAGKGANIDKVALGVRDVWRTDRGQWLIALPHVTFADGSDQTYLLPLGAAWEDASDTQTGLSAEWSLAKVREKAKAGVLIDAFADDQFCLSLVESMARSHSVSFASQSERGGELRFAPTQAFLKIAPATLQTVTHLSGEQSNTSAIVGETYFLKGYRRLRSGINPETEMTRYLTERTSFAHFAPLAGTLEFVSEHHETFTLAAVFGFVSNQGDGWQYTLNHLERFGATVRADSPSLESAAVEQDESHTLYLAQLTTLGKRVGALHRALAQPSDEVAFAPEPIRESDLQEWAKEVRAAATDTLRLLRERLIETPEAARPALRALLESRKALLERIKQLAATPVAAFKTRFHGDLHLGQVLLVADDFLIIDFEGEPGRPMQERRRKHSVLRDVAGMLRSFDYARAVALDRAVSVRPDAHVNMALAFAEWRQRATTSFLQGYRDGVQDAPCMPAEFQDAERLIELFQVEKALYELRYEMENRPAWVGVPAGGLLDLLRAH